MGYRRVRRDGFVPDLVHAHFFLSALPAALFGKPMVETEQWTIFLPEDPAELSTPLRLGARAALSRARLILPVSESLRDAMRAAGVRGEFRVIPNAVDVSLFAPRERPSGARLVSVGMLQFQKGVDDLLQAFAAVRAQRPDATLEIVGDGPDRREYEELARKLDLDGSVTFHGLLPKSRIAGLLSTANLFVLASRFDNNPCVLVEAQAAGLPIVSTRVGGIPEIVGEAGILTERDDSDAFAAAILHALSELGRYDPHEIAAAARSRYSIEQVGLQLADAYRSALS
jgi:glycosyltransferase involved in cell wall biosynthesis